jgi:hypothetical protein
VHQTYKNKIYQLDFIMQERLNGDAAVLPIFEWICLGSDILIGLEQIISP